MTTTDFPDRVAAEIARIETEIGARSREIDRLRGEQESLAGILAHLYPLREAYGAAGDGNPEPDDDAALVAMIEAVTGEVACSPAQKYRLPLGHAPVNGQPPASTEDPVSAEAISDLGPELAQNEGHPFAAAAIDTADEAAEGASLDTTAEAPPSSGPEKTDLPGPHSRGPDWSTDDDARLVELVGEGRTQGEIAAAMERTIPAVASRIRNLRAAGVKVTPPVGRREKTTPQEVLEIRRLAVEGLAVSDIGMKLGLSNRVVALTIKNAELSAAAEAERKASKKTAEPGPDLHTLPAEVGVPADPVDGTTSKPEAVAPAPQLEPEPREIVTGPWSPDEDLILVEGLAEGRLLAPVMERLGRGQVDCLARFDELVGPDQSGRCLREAVERVRQRAALPMAAE